MSAELGAPALVQALRAHAGEVSCCAAHGVRLATGGGSVLRLWEWRKGAGWAVAGEARTAHRFGVTCARWAPSGVLLASCGVDGALRVWCGRRLAARRLLAAGGAAAARALCWAGGRLLAGHDDGTVRVWAVGAARLLARLAPLAGAVHALCTPARHALLLVACTEGVLKVFDLDEVCRGGTAQGAGPTPLLAECGAHDLGALSAAHSEDGAVAATGGHDASVRLWRVQGRGRNRCVVAGERLEGHSAAVTALAFARGVLASASLDRTARLWLVPRGAPPACLHVLHAHPRYLTCLALAHDLSYLITGSNDKSIRMWGLRGLSLDDELVPPCDGLAHFALGDLQGISPLDDDELVEMDGLVAEEEGGERAGGARLAWRGRVHAGAVNCVIAHGDLLATASSDGLVKVLRCTGGALAELHVLDAHQYPAQHAAWGRGGGVLLSAGLDGQAVLWDTQAGVRLRTLSLGASAGGGDSGGGGVRGAAVSPHRPPLLLLATDDGLAPVWTLQEDDPQPIHVYLTGEAAGAAWCVCWAPGGAAAAVGGAGGELRVLAPPPPHDRPRQLALVPDAHDLGVTSCEFASSAEAVGLDADVTGVLRLVLATAGGDSLIKLWIVDLDEEREGGSARLQLARLVGAHGGAAARACWGGDGALLASAGADDWARVWAADGACLAAVPAAATGAVDTALSATLLRADDALYIAFGTLQGQVALWRLPAGLEDAADEAGEEEAALDVRWWGGAGVRHWLQEHVTRVPVLFMMCFGRALVGGRGGGGAAGGGARRGAHGRAAARRPAAGPHARARLRVGRLRFGRGRRPGAGVGSRRRSAADEAAPRAALATTRPARSGSGGLGGARAAVPAVAPPADGPGARSRRPHLRTRRRARLVPGCRGCRVWRVGAAPAQRAAAAQPRRAARAAPTSAPAPAPAARRGGRTSGYCRPVGSSRVGKGIRFLHII